MHKNVHILNILSRFGTHLVVMVLTILMVPYVIRMLGVEAYGLIGVVNSVMALLSVATISLTSLVGRNMVFHLAKGDSVKAEVELNTAIFGAAIALFALIPFVALFAFYSNDLLKIDPEFGGGAKYLIALAFGAFFLGALSGPLGSAMFVRNRFDLVGLAALARTVMFFLLVAFLLNVKASLTSYGVALFLSNLAFIFLHFKIHRYLLPQIKVSINFFRWRALSGLASSSGWMVLNQIGVLLFLQIDLLVANQVLGAGAAGKMAAILIIPVQIRALAGLMAGIFSPHQTILATVDDKEDFSTHLLSSIRVTTLFVSVMVGVFCGFAKEILGIWLGPDFLHLSSIAIVMTSCLVVTLGISPAWGALLAVGKIKTPAIVTLVAGLVNIALAIVLAKNFGLMGLAIAGAITLSLRNVVFTPFYVAQSIGVRVHLFFVEMLYGIFATLAIFIASALISATLGPTNFIELVLALSMALIVSGVMIFPFAYRAFKKLGA